MMMKIIDLVPFSGYRRIKIEYSLLTPPHTCLTPPLRGTRQNFWIKLIPQKLEELDYSVVKVA